MSSRRWFVVIYAMSGAAALVYEVAWTRMLTLQLGHTVAAASTVLAAFMGGLAIGAWAAGSRRIADTIAGLRAYAILELIVAALALLLPFALRASFPLLASAYADGDATARFAIVRVGISLVLVGLPAAAMGATFPIAAGALAKNAADAGALYAANTTGAAVGAIAAGFWLVPAFGLRGTTLVGVALNVIAAGGASVLGTLNAKVAQVAQKSRPLRVTNVSSAPGLARAATAVSGFAALVYEVAWTRLLAVVIGPTTYAFATMAASFIGGLAIGSALGTRVARRSTQPARWLALLLAGGSIAATASAWYAATQMPLVVAAQVNDPSAQLAAVVSLQALEVGVLLLPMTLSLGATFPVALAVAGMSNVASDTARVYAANTCGAIAGALAAGFVLIPRVGLRATIQIAALLAAAAAVGVLARTAKAFPPSLAKSPVRAPARLAGAFGGGGQLPAVAVAAAFAAILFMPPWDPALLASGAYKYAPYLGAVDLDAVLRAGQLLYYKEGAAAAVSVRELSGTRSLAIDGKVDASNAGDMLTQRMLGLLPVLIHGNAREIAVIGLGSGVTVGSALASGTVERVDVIEISPEVVDASGFFDKESGQALAQPGVRLIVGDGRSHLLLTSRSYDVIVSEPSNPWMAGVASLFTREFFEAARARLKPNGILCQWAHTYDIRADDLRSIARTFASVFPQGTMWLVGGGDLLLIGARDGDVASRLGAVETGGARGRVSAALADVGVDAGTTRFAVLSLYAGGPKELDGFAGNSVIQTDDRTPLEYSAPRGIYGRTGDDNAAAIRGLAAERPDPVRQAFDRASDRDWVSRATMDLRAQAFVSAYDAFRQAVLRNSTNATALAGLSDAAGGANKLTEERNWLREIALQEPRNAAVRIELSRVLAVSGVVEAAADAVAEALRITPDDPHAAEQLASVLADSGNERQLTPLATELVSRFPDRVESRFYYATALFMSGRTVDAVDAARRIVDVHPTHARAQGLLGAACAALGRRECAQTAFDASIRANPRDPSAYVNAGTFQLETANPSAAAGFFASALAIDPTSAAARNGLARARAMNATR
jgi:spermidine synthase